MRRALSPQDGAERVVVREQRIRRLEQRIVGGQQVGRVVIARATKIGTVLFDQSSVDDQQREPPPEQRSPSRLRAIARKRCIDGQRRAEVQPRALQVFVQEIGHEAPEVGLDVAAPGRTVRVDAMREQRAIVRRQRRVRLPFGA